MVVCEPATQLAGRRKAATSQVRGFRGSASRLADLRANPKVMFYVYILESPQGKRYIGSCEDLERRLKEHKKKRPGFQIIYSETRLTRSEAFQREMFFKTGNGRKVLQGLLTEV